MFTITTSHQLSKPFTALGEYIRDRYRTCNYNQADLPVVAAEALAQFDSEFTFDAASIGAFFSTTPIRQQPQLPFSNLPITVFRHRDFYIEILVWTNSTTSVHQHSFSGAFRVLQGSSLHTKFAFKSQKMVNQDCILGLLEPQHTEYLHTGSVRQIHPGPEGLIHSLYHLENPSLTLVVRSHGHAMYEPQYSYHRPYLAFDPFKLEKDEQVIMTAKLLQVASQIDRPSMVQIWLEQIAQFDFSRLAWLFLNYKDYLEEAEQQHFFDHARQNHNTLVDSLEKVAQYQTTLHHISHSRTVLTDPDLRYFLALLMNAKDRAALLDMVKVRYPDEDPLECCARWLAKLSEGKTDTALRLTQIVQQANLGALHLGRKLGVALPPKVANKQAEALFLSFIRDGNQVSDVAAHFPDIAAIDLQKFFDHLGNLEELGCLR